MDTVDELELRDVFRGVGSPALVVDGKAPEALWRRILSAPGLPKARGGGVVYDRELAGGARRADADGEHAGELPGWFALLGCGAVVPELERGADGGDTFRFHPVFLPWPQIKSLSHDRDWEGYLAIAGHEIDTSPLSPLQTEILYHGIRHLVSRATGTGFSFGQRRCIQDESARPQGLLPVGPWGGKAEVVLGCSREYVRFRARQMGLGPELWDGNP